MAVLRYAKSLQSCPTLCDPIDAATRPPRPWDFPGKNTGVGCHCLLRKSGYIYTCITETLCYTPEINTL